MPSTQRLPGTPRARPSLRLRRILIGCAVVLGLAGLLYVVLPAGARRVIDWLWFREIGLERVFLARLRVQWALGLAAAGASFAFFYANVRLARRAATAPVGPEEERARRLARAPASMGLYFARLAARFDVWVAAAGAVLLGIWTAGSWLSALLLIHRTPFGVADPAFGRDMSHYVFTLPAIEILFELVYTILFGAAALAVALYVDGWRIRLRGWLPTVHPAAGRHLGTLLALALAVVALHILLVGIPRLVYSTTGPFVGASYTDLHARLPGLRLAILVALAAAAAVLVGAWTRRFVRIAAIALAAGAAVSLLAAYAFPAVYQRLVVLPNELQRETPQIEHHLRATALAWGLSDVEVRELRPGRPLTDSAVRANGATIRNVNLWNRDLLLQTFGQLQSIRTYYDFVSADEDRYMIDGEHRQVHLSARELNVELLPVRSFINERIAYTHGLGVALGPSNQATAEGLPLLFVKDIPPVSSIPLQVSRPEIYYGELTNDYVFVDGGAQAPAGIDRGRGEIRTLYAGNGGIEAGSFLRRVLLALRFRSPNILLTRQIGPGTRVLLHREIRGRAEMVLPGIRLDRDPYLVITDAGRLCWILDAYTVSRHYPYAQSPLRDGTNYMRNSIKVVIGAYDGDITAYLVDPGDPLIRTWQAAFPGVLQPLDSMPRDIRAHLRYPEDLFRAQAALYGIYHVDDAAVFYHREDQWVIPVMPNDDDPELYMQRMVMRLPGETAPEFVTMTPFSPRHKDNLAAWMVARSDGPHYGELVAYRFPRQSLIYGPIQVVNRISQDTAIARSVSFWSQGGSEVLWGDLLVIPIEESLLYVQPLYLRAQGGRIPELKQVVVAYQNHVVMAESLERALARLVGGDAGPLESELVTSRESIGGRAPADEGVAELIRRALLHYEAARAAQRADDWAAYGREMRALGDVLRQLGGGGRRAP